MIGFALIALILIIFFLWAIRSTAKKPSKPEGTFLTEEQLAQRRYNAEQFHARTQKIIADAAVKPPVKHTLPVRPAAYKPPNVPKAVPVIKRPATPPVPIRRPAVSQWPFPEATPAPAPSSDPIGDMLVGAAIGYAVSTIFSDRDEGRSCSRDDSPSITSGGGGDFGGGGASSSWDDSSSSSSSSDSSSSSSND